MQAETDETLIRRFQRGERAAFEIFVRRHQDWVYRLAGVWLHGVQEAEDAAQEVFLRAWCGLGRFRFGARPATWLYRTLRNVCREQERRMAPGRALSPLAEGASPEEEAAGRLDRERRLERVRELLWELPRRQRDVVLLRVFEQMSTGETALVLGCRQGTVKALLHKALERLRRAELEAGGDGDA